MPFPAQLTRRSFCNPLGAAVLALVLAGCAQQKPSGYYDTPHDNTATDAQIHAQGRDVARAPSQIQLGFGNEEQKANRRKSQQQAAEGTAVKARAVAEAKTFLGTVPCLLNAGPGCSATRVTLTLAPEGQWRARTVLLDHPEPKNNIVQQGCWNVVATQPLRIVLQLPNEATKANLTFVNDNVLRINTIDDIKPTLDHHLTRQQDIDPIDEISSQTPLQCQ
ncbi:hypothetical protein CR155_18065 [Pollutimonas nitritireducens]|uniref:Lipoprotein n=1 Tax=Pollutimonas nitritireducens TaxID=2045209 RepID=A0A2N4UBL2_9BURK|nr:copper resistance protein NlpE N-terminal domain-containing protein [Pollutimonas nitritireducens]PLC52409.1 hypothetical protein CR155_18065 [Pollutimonas nitritireducens]